MKRLIQLRLILNYANHFQTDVKTPLPVIFEFVHNLDKDRVKQLFRTFAKTPVAKKVFASDKTVIDLIKTGSFAPGTFGACYKEWMANDKLEDVFSAYYPTNSKSKLSKFLHTAVMEHDIIHFINGYDTSTFGEIGVLAFNLAREWRASYASILYASALMAFRNTFNPHKYPKVGFWKNFIHNPFIVFCRTVIEAWRRGKRAPWFMTVDWEAYLNVDLQIVKKELNLVEPPRYWLKIAPMWAKVHKQYLEYSLRKK
tara:strand:+ start:41 stop:808 length:768 start_codon:yes stop_codon:yes gene_type:complete